MCSSIQIRIRIRFFFTLLLQQLLNHSEYITI